jgi:hypothetical protein
MALKIKREGTQIGNFELYNYYGGETKGEYVGSTCSTEGRDKKIEEL